MGASEGSLELRLRSPVKDAPDEVYRWPLDMIDEYDPAFDLLETIRLVSKEFPELDDMFTDDLGSVDRKNFAQMSELCARYNLALDQIHKVNFGGAPAVSTSAASFELVHHIMQQVYNRVIDDPMRLNTYKGFSEEVYGEFTFEMINEVVREIALSRDDIFVDLGSGVGQVVLQVAAQAGCVRSTGIEKMQIPADYADKMSVEFRRRMAWWGKSYGAFELRRGDFLSESVRPRITEASVLFVNNFAFGPELNHSIRQIFPDLREGARIVSSLNFCPLNFRITERSHNDVSAIVRVRKITYTGEGVSWTAKPFDYYVHTIDRSMLESFYKNRTAPQAPLAKADNGDGVSSSSEEEWGARRRKGKSTPAKSAPGTASKSAKRKGRPLYSVLLRYMDGDTSDASSVVSVVDDTRARAKPASVATGSLSSVSAPALKDGGGQKGSTESPASTQRRPGRPARKPRLPLVGAGADDGANGDTRGLAVPSVSVSMDDGAEVDVVAGGAARDAFVGNALFDEYVSGLRERFDAFVGSLAPLVGAMNPMQRSFYEAEMEKKLALEQQIEEAEAEIHALDRKGRRLAAKGLRQLKISLVLSKWKKLQQLLRILSKHEKLLADTRECVEKSASLKAEMAVLSERLRESRRGTKRRTELKQLKRSVRVIMDFAGLKDLASPGDLLEGDPTHLAKLADIFAAGVRRLESKALEQSRAFPASLAQPQLRAIAEPFVQPMLAPQYLQQQQQPPVAYATPTSVPPSYDVDAAPQGVFAQAMAHPQLTRDSATAVDGAAVVAAAAAAARLPRIKKIPRVANSAQDVAHEGPSGVEHAYAGGDMFANAAAGFSRGARPNGTVPHGASHSHMQPQHVQARGGQYAYGEASYGYDNARGQYPPRWTEQQSYRSDEYGGHGGDYRQQRAQHVQYAQQAQQAAVVQPTAAYPSTWDSSSAARMSQQQQQGYARSARPTGQHGPVSEHDAWSGHGHDQSRMAQMHHRVQYAQEVPDAAWGQEAMRRGMYAPRIEGEGSAGGVAGGYGMMMPNAPGQQQAMHPHEAHAGGASKRGYDEYAAQYQMWAAGSDEGDRTAKRMRPEDTTR